MKVIITKLGASLPSNDWEEGQEIECHENLAAHFIETGIAEDPEGESRTPKQKELKTSKQKTK